jgi:hypothetical protein
VRAFPLVLFATALLDCTSFAPIPAATCGNGVIDASEDCDTFSVGATACRPPTASSFACRFDCSSTACPTGYGCGADDVCRKPSGKFAATGTQVAAGAWRLLAGDFDGDRRIDVLSREPIALDGQSRTRLHFFDENAALARTLVIPPTIAAPTVVDVNADARADLVFSSFGSPGNPVGGLGTMLGQQDRTLSPVAYPTFTFPITARLIPIHGLAATTSFVFYTKDPTQGASLGVTDATGAGVRLVSFPSNAEPFASSISVGRFYESSANWPCECAVLALPNTPDVLIYPLCRVQNGSPVVNTTGIADLHHVKLPPNLTVDRGVLVADADGDGHLDLLIAALDGTPPVQKTFIAYGTGGVGFRSTPNGPIDDLASTFRVNKVGEEDFEPALPLAVGDMNLDGKPDLVTPQSVLVSQLGTGVPASDGGTDAGGDGGTQKLTYFVAGQKARGTWTDAKIADFNGNGFPDVIAGSSASLDLDFFSGNGVESFSSFTLTTNGPASNFSVGDVDGDYLPDLVFAQVGTGADDLAIAYGRLGGAPDSPMVVGSFAKIGQTLTYDPGAPLANTVVIDHPLGMASTNVSILAGSGDRDPLALFSLSRPHDVNDVPLAVVPGAFSTAGNFDFVALGQDLDPLKMLPSSTFRLWLAKATSTPMASVTPQLASPVKGPTLRSDAAPFVGTETAFGISALLAQGDVNGDGVPEVVMLLPRSALGDGADSQLLIAKARSDATAFDVSDPIALGVHASTDGQLAVVDVDDDGALDVVALTGPEGAFTLVVYWNDGKGGFSPQRSTAIATSGDLPTGFALVRVALNEPRAIAYTTLKSVVLAHINPKDRTARPERLDVTMKGATGIVAADIDGNGVEDLAVADSNNIVILRAQPVLP